MTSLLLGLIIFLTVHSISIVNDPWRNDVVKRIGEWTWKAIYSLVSLFGLLLIIKGYGIARLDSAVLYNPPMWLRNLSLLLLVPVFPLLLAPYFPGRIKAATHHPMLLATILWAIAHLLADGSLVNLILFGSFLAWAVLDRFSVRQRQLRPVPGAPVSTVNDTIVTVFGLGLYLAFLCKLHGLLLGVPII